ncbi:MAG: putative Ig domain-containing protein [Bacteroidales bacterium]
MFIKLTILLKNTVAMTMLVFFDISYTLSAQNQAPDITNYGTIIYPGDRILKIQYDLTDNENDNIRITLKISNNRGKDFYFPITNISGDIGYPVTPGNRKTVTWNFPDSINYSMLITERFVIKLIADDLQPFDIQELVNQVDSNRLLQDLNLIQGIRHRVSGVQNLANVKNLIESRLGICGMPTERKNVPFTNDDGTAYTGQNIIGRLSGNYTETAFYILDGHFDTVINSPGADDNGSAVAGFLEAARVLSKYCFDKTIKFIGFDLEEAGITGSRIYARTCIPANEQLQGVINFEMIGCYKTANNSQTLPNGFSTLFPEFYQKVASNNFKADFAFNISNVASNDLKAEFDNCAAQYVPQLKVYSLSVAGDGSSVPDLRRSDHRSFWDAGYKALMITDGANFRNTNYHTPADLANTLNYTFMANIVKTTIATLAKLCGPIHGNSKTFRITSPLQGKYTIGNSGNYLNLTSVSRELRTRGITGNLVLEILNDYDATTETIPVLFDKIIYLSTNTGVTIMPSAGLQSVSLSMTGNADNEALVIFDNVKNFKFDGRPGGIGNSCLAITNTRSLNPGPVFEFRNGAQFDTLSYLTLKSNIQSLTGGVIVIGKTNKSYGNSNNVIEYCNITGNPRCGIYSLGTPGFQNTNNKINSCYIYDFFSPTEDADGIYVGNNNSANLITNNRFFQTSAKTFTQDQYFCAIHIDTQTGTDFRVSGNKIGFSNQTESGNTIISGANSHFAGIWINTNSESNSVIENNTISNINFSSSYNGKELPGIFSGICVQNGNAEIGSIGKGNLIGPNLTSECSGIQNVGYSNGIKTTGNGTITIGYNTIAGLSGNSTVISGISSSGKGNSLITSNTIKELSASNNSSDYSLYSHSCQGIWISGEAENIISSNTMFNITNLENAITNVSGIYESSANAIIEKNVIYNINNNSNSLGKTANGIFLTKLNAGYVSNNMISLGLNDNTEYRGICIAMEDVLGLKKIYFNSVWIGGNSSGVNSFCIMRGNFSAPLDIRNNIFTNSRCGNGKHYAVATQYTLDWTSSFTKSNSYYSLSPATLALWGSTDNNYSTWINNTGGDPDWKSNNSLPEFVNPAIGDLHLNPSNNCSFNGSGEYIQNVTLDFDGSERQPHPDLGADEIVPTGGNLSDRWIGRIDNNWDNPGNWQCELAPLTNSNLTITENGNSPIISRTPLAQSIIINSLTINPGAKLELYAGNSLTLNGPLTVNGTLVLQSPENSDASATLIDNGTISGDGKIIVERYLSGGSYHYISSPIQVGGNSNSSLFTTNQNGTFNPVFYKYDESFNLPSNPEPFISQVLVAGWIPAHHGEGHSPENLNITQGYASYNAANRMISFSGLTNTGNFDINNLSFTPNDPITGELANYYDGWHLLGNPYPSYLDWNKVIEDGLLNIDNGIYVWDGYQYAGYQNGISVMSGNQGNLIAPAQGFFVHVNANPGAIKIRNHSRSNDFYSNQSFLKSSKFPSKLLKIKATANGFRDYAAIEFDKNASKEFDAQTDMFKLFSNNSEVPHLYSLVEKSNLSLSINSLPVNFIDSCIVKLGFRIGVPSHVTFCADELIELEGTHIYLSDKNKNEVLNLRIKNSYEFDISDTITENRFQIKFSKNSPPFLNKLIENQITMQDSWFEFNIDSNTFKDNDEGDRLRISVSLSDGRSLPNWLHFDAENFVFSGTPLDSDVGVLNITISAADIFNDSVSGQFIIEIVNKNDAPELNVPVCDVIALEDEIFEFYLNTETFLDKDEYDNLNYKASLSNGEKWPAWLLFNSEKLLFSGNPKGSDIGTLDINICAIDNSGAEACDNFTINVVDINDKPIVKQNIESQEIFIGEEYYFKINQETFDDEDENDIITLSCKLSNGNKLPEWLNFDEENGIFSGYAKSDGNYELTLTGSDKLGASASISFQLKVLSKNEISWVLKNSLDIFPNPSNNILNINFSGNFVNLNLDLNLLDAGGRLVHKFKINGNKNQLVLPRLKTGNYFIDLIYKNLKVTKPIIINQF